MCLLRRQTWDTAPIDVTLRLSDRNSLSLQLFDEAALELCKGAHDTQKKIGDRGIFAGEY